MSELSSRIATLLSVVELLKLTLCDLEDSLKTVKEEVAALEEENRKIGAALFRLDSNSISMIHRQSGKTVGGVNIE
jgi:hypothetical protein